MRFGLHLDMLKLINRNSNFVSSRVSTELHAYNVTLSSSCRLQLQPLNISWTTVTEPALAARINFKLVKLCYLATSFQQPGYLADLISPYSQSRLLRSSTRKLLSVPPHNLGHCCTSFLCCCSETLELSSTELSNCSIR